MIAELLKFAGLVRFSVEDWEKVNLIILSEDQQKFFAEEVKKYVYSGFVPQNPCGLTTIERAYYFLFSEKFRLEQYKKQAVIFREILGMDKEVSSEDILKGQDIEQDVLEEVAKRAVIRA